jgi:hypothetical protein
MWSARTLALRFPHSVDTAQYRSQCGLPDKMHAWQSLTPEWSVQGRDQAECGIALCEGNEGEFGS